MLHLPSPSRTQVCEMPERLVAGYPAADSSPTNLAPPHEAWTPLHGRTAEALAAWPKLRCALRSRLRDPIFGARTASVQQVLAKLRSGA